MATNCEDQPSDTITLKNQWNSIPTGNPYLTAEWEKREKQSTIIAWA